MGLGEWMLNVQDEFSNNEMMNIDIPDGVEVFNGS